MADQLTFRLGLDTITSYKRLSYTPWHALAEFVDNSTQSYFNNEEALNAAYEKEGAGLRVDVSYERETGVIRVTDNAMGMHRDELDYALEVGARPINQSGRSKYGMGLKTAACWLGNKWTVRTKKLGETVELLVEVDVAEIAAGNQDLPTRAVSDQDPDTHYTVVEISELNRPLYGRQHQKIRDFLSSMYRQDLRDGILDLRFQGEQLEWDFPDDLFLQTRDGSRYKKEFSFEVEDKVVIGWIGILDRGSRAKAGFSILHAGRVVKGWPDAWRPSSIYGQIQGSNDVINQRVVGEIVLDDFHVTHTKDDILWFGDEQDQVETKLKEETADYVGVARDYRKGGRTSDGPTEIEVQTAIEEFQAELTSAELADLVTVKDVLPPDAVRESMEAILDVVSGEDPDFSATINDLTVRGYRADDMSPHDPYVIADSTSADAVTVIVNMRHPHIRELVGTEGVLNYLRHCTYDALAEWKARQLTADLDPDTVKTIKDGLLRIAMEIEMHEPASID